MDVICINLNNKMDYVPRGFLKIGDIYTVFFKDRHFIEQGKGNIKVTNRFGSSWFISSCCFELCEEQNYILKGV